ncbi:unnamed protein product [Hydatigera taeniaeformis]|uniref:PFK domain-containing protein n=1 Tax=Hydatigena taeniaeformis TaxID=6205 RepID=A0A0R3WQW7_HYDTA|nr:unnamed protein product [Hydatigera taeniaeformis]
MGMGDVHQIPSQWEVIELILHRGMSNGEWDRLGIVPGLQGDSQQKRPSVGRTSGGLFGYIADPNDSKTPPGIGEQNTGPISGSQLTHKLIDRDNSSPASGVPTQAVEAAPTVRTHVNLTMHMRVKIHFERADCSIPSCFGMAIGETLDNNKNVQEIDATNLVISPGLVDYSATSNAFSNKLGVEGMADQALIRDATSQSVLAGVTTIVDTVYSDDGHSPLSAIAAYLQALQTTHVHCNVAVRAGIRHLSVGTISDIEQLTKRHCIKSFLLSIPENDRILCEHGNPESTVLYGVLSACRSLGVVPTIGLDRITGSHVPQTEGVRFIC